MKKEDRQSQNRKHKITVYFLILPGHYTRKIAFYPSSKLEGNHANPSYAYFSFSDWSTLWNQTTKTLQNSIQIHTTQNWKGTGTYISTDCYSILTYPALWCNLGVL